MSPTTDTDADDEIESNLSNDDELTPYVEALLDGKDVLLQGASKWGPTRFSLSEWAEGKDKFGYYIGSYRKTERGDKLPGEEFLWTIDEREVRHRVRDGLDADEITVVIEEGEEDGEAETDADDREATA